MSFLGVILATCKLFKYLSHLMGCFDYMNQRVNGLENQSQAFFVNFLDDLNMEVPPYLMMRKSKNGVHIVRICAKHRNLYLVDADDVPWAS